MSSSSTPPTLAELGFDRFFAEQLPGPEAWENVARVASERRERYGLLSPRGALDAILSGRLRHDAANDPGAWPKVGDWVELAPETPGDLGIIERVLERKTCFARRAPGEGSFIQVIAANIDTVLVVCAASSSNDASVQRRGVSLSRLERYAAAARQSGARALCVVNKIDLARDPIDLVATVSGALGEDVPVVATSAIRGDGVDELRSHIGERETLALVGSSGVGKSALVNRLLGHEVARLGAVRTDDERGRHTTTHRELHLLPRGGALIDTPGMRELGLTWEASELEPIFDDIARLAQRCRFRDCRHSGEPGCAVIEAIERGALDARRLSSRQKLERELAHERQKLDPEARRRARSIWRQRAAAHRLRDKLERR